MAITIYRRTYAIKPQQSFALDRANSLCNGLVGYWAFSSYTGGVVPDQLQYGPGTLGGTSGTPSWELREKGMDLAFVAANGQFVSVADNPSLRFSQGFGIEVLFWPNTARNFNGLVSKTNSNQPGPWDMFSPSNAHVNFNVGNGSSNTGTGSTAFIQTGWNHFVAAYDPSGTGSLLTCLNGFCDAAVSASSQTVTDTANPIRFGNRNDGATALDGKIAYVRIWNRPLRTSDAMRLWSNPYQIISTSKRVFFNSVAAAGSLLVNPGMTGGMKDFTGGING